MVFNDSKTAMTWVKGIEVAHYKVYYADGTEERIPVVYGRDTGRLKLEGLRERMDDPSRVVWQGGTDGNSPGLVQFSWSNPHPEKVITQFDFVSAKAAAAPFLLAITLE